MPVSEDDMIVSTVGYFVTENRLNPLATPAEIAAFVRAGQHTGQLQFQTNQGGVLGVVFMEKKRLTDDEDNEVRRVLGMDYEKECDDEDADEEN